MTLELAIDPFALLVNPVTSGTSKSTGSAEDVADAVFPTTFSAIAFTLKLAVGKLEVGKFKDQFPESSIVALWLPNDEISASLFEGSRRVIVTFCPDPALLFAEITRPASLSAALTTPSPPNELIETVGISVLI